VKTIAFSPDGSHLASGSHDCTVRLWDATPETSIAKHQVHSDAISAIAFSPNGLRLASGAYDCTIQLWDAISGTSIAKLEGHGTWIRTIGFSPDGSYLASHSNDNTLQLWDAVSGASIPKLKHRFRRRHQATISFNGGTLTSHPYSRHFTWNLTSQPPHHLASRSSVATPGPSVGLTQLIWSVQGQWLQVKRKEDNHTRHICYIPPDYSIAKISASSHPTHPRIAVGCRDGRVIILDPLGVMMQVPF
jgi:WD40 repeat protein